VATDWHNLFAVTKAPRTDSGSESHEHVGGLCNCADRKVWERNLAHHMRTSFTQLVARAVLSTVAWATCCHEVEMLSDSSRTSGDDLPRGHLLEIVRGRSSVEQGEKIRVNCDGVPRDLPWWNFF
jgi:hypothetical protein